MMPPIRRIPFGRPILISSRGLTSISLPGNSTITSLRSLASTSPKEIVNTEIGATFFTKTLSLKESAVLRMIQLREIGEPKSTSKETMASVPIGENVNLTIKTCPAKISAMIVKLGPFLTNRLVLSKTTVTLPKIFSVLGPLKEIKIQGPM